MIPNLQSSAHLSTKADLLAHPRTSKGKIGSSGSRVKATSHNKMVDRLSRNKSNLLIYTDGSLMLHQVLVSDLQVEFEEEEGDGSGESLNSDDTQLLIDEYHQANQSSSNNGKRQRRKGVGAGFTLI